MHQSAHLKKKTEYTALTCALTHVTPFPGNLTRDLISDFSFNSHKNFNHKYLFVNPTRILVTIIIPLSVTLHKMQKDAMVVVGLVHPPADKKVSRSI